MLFNRSLYGIVAVALALALGSSAAASPGDPSGDGIQPFEVSGNASCQEVFGPNSIELKQEPPKDATISDGTLTVTVDLSDDKNFMDFSGATVPINGVIIKAATSSNVYSYPLTDTADTLLHGAIDANGIHAISHISFCYGAAPPPCVPPAVGLHPLPVVTTYGDGNVQFTASASGGTAPISVKWQVSTAGAAGPFTDIPGATTTTLTVVDPSVVDDDGNHYRAVFTNACGSANSNPALLTVNPKAVPGTCTVADKVYDGNTSATITGSALGAGVLPGDDVTLDASGASSAFPDEDAGSYAVPCNGFALAGADAGNYTLTMSNTTAAITPKPITGNCTVANKVYDGTTNATVTGSSLSGVVAGDQVNLTGGSSAFGNPDVGTGKPTPCNGFALAGADAGNYTLTMNPTTANITPKPVLVTCTAADKAFDGNNSATITGAILTGVVPGDSVSVGGGSATFNNPDPGEDKPVTCTGFFLEGPDKDNYVLAVDHPTATIQRPPAESPREACLKRNIFAFVRTGNDAKRVVFFLDGEKLTTVRKRDKKGRFGVHLVRRELGPGKHVLSAIVYFKTGRKPVKLIVFRFKPCLGSDVAKELSVTNFGGVCVRRSFLIFVKGDTISNVAFSLNGKRLRMVHIADGKGRYKVLIRPSQLRKGKNTLAAKITYIRSAKTKPVTLKKTVRAC